MWGEPTVTRHIGGRPFTREDVWARILRYIGHWTALGYGFWVVRDRAGKFVGEVGISNFKRDLVPPIEYPELGWALASPMQGKGYATEATLAALAWGEKHVGPRYSCMIDPGNGASLRVAQKCGFVEKRRVTYHGDTAIVFVR
jgi:RimJ/RimL family protein N-acetyltransferase